jgi:hypothetical protein
MLKKRKNYSDAWDQGGAKNDLPGILSLTATL